MGMATEFPKFPITGVCPSLLRAQRGPFHSRTVPVPLPVNISDFMPLPTTTSPLKFCAHSFSQCFFRPLPLLTPPAPTRAASLSPASTRSVPLSPSPEHPFLLSILLQLCIRTSEFQSQDSWVLFQALPLSKRLEVNHSPSLCPIYK